MQDIIFPASVKGRLSLDRVTFLLFSPRLSLWSADEFERKKNESNVEKVASMVMTLLSSELDEDFPQGSPSELFKHHFRTIDGVDIQFGARMPKRKKLDDLSYLAAYGDDLTDRQKYVLLPQSYAFRVEYNPNSTDLDAVKKLLGFFGKSSQGTHAIRIARLDIAIDFAASILPELVLCDGMRKSFTASGSKGLESVYFGTRQSKNYFRLYNKRQEQLDKLGVDIGYDLWRLELESKEAFYLDKCPDFGKVFERFSFYDGAVSTGDWTFDLIRSQAMVYGLQNVLRRMPVNTATRYRKMFKECSFQDVEKPSLVYYRDFPLAMERLTVQIMNACGFEMYSH